MLNQALIDQIKGEARVEGDDNFDAKVIGIINEVTIEAVQLQRPFELRKEVTISLPVDGMLPLPGDYLFHHEVFFVDSDTVREWKIVDQDSPAQPAPRGMYGHPKSFEVLADSKLSVKPISSLVIGDAIRLGYYAKPVIISDANTLSEYAIPRLAPFVIRATIRRLRMYHIDDASVITALTGDIASAAKGYTKDEPIGNSGLDKSGSGA